MKKEEKMNIKQKIKISNTLKNKYKNGYINPMYGKHHSKETKKKISDSEKGKIISKETREKIGLNNVGFKDKKHSEKSKKKMSKIRRELFKNGYINPMKGKKQTIEHARKLREARVKYRNGNNILCFSLGKNEKRILDELELSIESKIIRQYPICGYFLDGYCKDLNISFEVDEIGHKYHKEKDKIRQKEIMKELNCDFIRIKDNF